MGKALAELLGQAHVQQRVGNPLTFLRRRQPRFVAQRFGDDLADGHARVQG